MLNLVLLLREGAAAEARFSSFTLWLLQDMENVFSSGSPHSSISVEKVPGVIWAAALCPRLSR